MAQPSSPPAVDLTNCDREPIHIPGAIQAHGLLLTIQDEDLTVQQVSENVAQHLSIAPAEILGRSLEGLLDDQSARALRAALAEERIEAVNPLALRMCGRAFDGICHRHLGATIVELEPAEGKSAPLAHSLRVALSTLEGAQSVDELCRAAVTAVRRLTGFDRVMIYRFDQQGHGSVIAEARHEQLEPYLGLHYPASDIPRQARELYLRNWLRIIPDASYTPARIVPALRPDTGEPLDLSHAALRSVSPIHLEYMRNMGVVGSMSISLVVRGELWGLVSCANHEAPRFLRYEARAACEVVGRLLSL